MTPQETIRRYPRLATILLAIAEEDDVLWAASILDAAKYRRSPLSQGLVREAWRKRRDYRRKRATRVVESFLGEVPFPSTFSPPKMDAA